ncbi:SPOR domain-containing protein [Azonexus sp.]|uniref:SPOR domain-containing protein n=1 Tax=Azonexus sp. TaxID=1872668 RepID=UPI0039E326C4
MAEDLHTAGTPTTESADLRRQLSKRLAVAGGLVLLLLALLAVFDRLSQPAEEADAPEFTEAVPVAPKKPLTQPLSLAPEESEAPANTAEEAAPAVTDAPPPPDIAATPASPGKTEHAPAPAAGKATKNEVVVAEGTAAPPLALDTPRPAQAKQAKTSSASAPHAVVVTPPRQNLELTPPPPRPARSAEGFLLQAGVFNSAERAEELHAKLTLNGIPTQVETRVQVGPFHTRQEALAAQAKLKALGIESLLVLPKATR